MNEKAGPGDGVPIDNPPLSAPSTGEGDPGWNNEKLPATTSDSDLKAHLNSPPGSAGDDFDEDKKKAKKAQEEDDRLNAIIDALDPAEANVIRRQIDIKSVAVSFFQLYRYATRNDLIIVVISTIAAIVAGAALPVMTVVFGDLSNQFSELTTSSVSVSDFESDLSRMVLYFVYIGIASFVATYIATAGFLYTGEHIAGQVRKRYMRSLLRQNVGFFDRVGAGEITTRITTQTTLVQDGMSEKVSTAISAIATFVGALIVSFIKNWKFTFILLSVVVALVLVMGVGGALSMKWMADSQKEYAKAGTIAEEVLSSVRTATAFNTQEKLAEMYAVRLRSAAISGFRFQSSWSYIIGGMFLIIYLSYGLAFWQGVRFLIRGDMSLGELLTILMAIIIGAFSLGNAASTFKSVGSAIGAAQQIYSTIQRQSPMDPLQEDGLSPEKLVGDVELVDVRHIYPSRPDVVVMDGVSLKVPAGKSTALVGASGSGKSTIIGLIERFYEPVGGKIFIDGHDISELNLGWIRRNIALVSQEPVLFATTIEENIRYGLPSSMTQGLSEAQIHELVVAAAKMANAHDFIQAQPRGYETDVGERGMLLSGGQKQRVAIARAVISNPQILLLDEATSALDTKSEGIVQAALDQASSNRTTIVIAHRLSTIKNADNIVVMSNGKIIEQGTHDQLLAARGAYFELVEAQKMTEATGTEPVEDGSSSAGSAQMPTGIDGRVGDKNLVDPDDENIIGLGRQGTTKSKASIALEAGMSDTESDKKYTLWYLIKVVAGFNREEWYVMLAGFVACVIAGAGQPVQAVFYAKSLASMTLPLSESEKMRSDVDFWTWMFFMLAWVVFIAFVVDGIAFAWCSEQMVRRVRDRAFRTMLRQNIAYFDEENNSTGGLTSFLSTRAQAIAGMSGATLGTIVMGLCTLCISIIVSISIGWKLGLVMTSTIPVLLGCGFLRFYLLIVFDERCKESYNSSAKYACETTSSIRTVASLSLEKQSCVRYDEALDRQMKLSTGSLLKTSSLFAASQSLSYLCFALGFWYGGRLMMRGEYSFFQFFVCYTTIIFGAQSAGTVLSFVPDMGKARSAALAMCQLFDRVPSIDWWSKDGVSVDEKSTSGQIEFQDVHFRYPSRPGQPVLRGLTLTARPGEFVALVGASGCGKSTTIQLIERFYDPLHGSVLLDGRDIRDYNLSEYRSLIALVSQEPTLYQSSIRENIAMGADRKVTEEEIVKACKDANVWQFVQTLPLGLDTPCGSKGALLSGGQKQRIAIARALVRNPRVLLLDEATSALDSSSEKYVQEALDRASKGRTTIAIAHRLSSIQRADRICVVEKGKIVEQGTHQELLAAGGVYAELVSLQGLGQVGS